MHARSTRSDVGLRNSSLRLCVLVVMALVLVAATLSSCGDSNEPTSTASTATSGLVSTTTPGTGTVDEITWDLIGGEPTTLDPVKAATMGRAL